MGAISTGWEMNGWRAALTENDLGVMFDGKLNVSQQCALVVQKANCIPCCMKQIVSNRVREVTVLLRSAFMRTHLQ